MNAVERAQAILQAKKEYADAKEQYERAGAAYGVAMRAHQDAEDKLEKLVREDAKHG